MKTFLRNIFLIFFSFLLISYLIPAINYSGKIEVLISASLVLALINILIKPILNILFLPINLITLGAFRWVVNIIVLLLVTIFVPEFKIVPFYFNGLTTKLITLKAFQINLFLSYVLVSFLITLILNFLNFILK